jgi:hypothetical protein
MLMMMKLEVFNQAMGTDLQLSSHHPSLPSLSYSLHNPTENVTEQGRMASQSRHPPGGG